MLRTYSTIPDSYHNRKELPVSGPNRSVTVRTNLWAETEPRRERFSTVDRLLSLFRPKAVVSTLKSTTYIGDYRNKWPRLERLETGGELSHERSQTVSAIEPAQPVSAIEPAQTV